LNLTELSSKLSRFETVRIETLGVDMRVKRLTLAELQDADRLTDSCSTGSGKNRQVTNLPKLVWTLVSRYFTDADGKPLAAEDDVEAAKEWPGSLVVELMQAFRRVNGGDEPDPN
jgi:hypothetical protein